MSTLMFKAGPGPSQMQGTSDGPRKRRKRAPAAGAADDCFTCSNRNIKCDRRRPYCSPCLESGQDCAGYKTQLTWGVGVASRGKLRGLSLPVAGTGKVVKSSSSPKKTRTSPPAPASVPFAASQNTLPLSPVSASESTFQYRHVQSSGSMSGQHGGRPQYQRARHTTGGSVSTATPIDLLPSPASTHLEITPTALAWSTANSAPSQHAFSLPPVSPIAYSAPAQHGNYFEHVPRTFHEAYGGSIDTYPNVDAIVNPIFPLDHAQSLHHNPRDQYHTPGSFIAHSEALQNSTFDLQHQQHSALEEDVEEIQRDDGSISDALSTSSGQLIFDMNVNWTPFSGTHAVGKTPRMQYLIQYYAEVIAPVIVAFDGYSNPFRNQILTLAAKSDSLQHALSALAASNLRQRKESGSLSTGKTLPARRSSQAHLSLTDSLYDTPIIPARDQKREEVFHKYHAVQSLNAALANPNLRKDDAVLATLLILCLFHICDSGIARFQTQFAGVKKLLTLRRSELGAQDLSTKWMTRLFTIFDAMAATVNEREGQFDSDNLEPAMMGDEEWSFETLAGLDGRLFKTLSKLGRLNLLGQGRPVESNPTLVPRPMPFCGDAALGNSYDAGSFDGTNWMRIVEDEHFFHSQTQHTSHSPYNQQSHMNGHDVSNESPKSEQFWREWREIRQQLQSWNLDTLLYETQSHPGGTHLTDEQRLDIENISNAFRYSALLYTERLSSPRIPSGHEKIQYWVRRSLHHIKRVRSDVYLLWPLFITGSECVHEDGRDIIRERCEDIQKDSGFVNNASCLALLEKVWRAVPVVPASTPSPGQGPNTGAGTVNGGFAQKLQYDQDHNVNGFRFRDVMSAEGNEGEWIVV